MVLLLPTEQVLLRRAAGSVRDGAMAVFGGRKRDVTVIDCAYPVDGVVATMVAASMTRWTGSLAR